MTAAANAGISLSTVLNVQTLFLLTAFCSYIKELVKILVVFAILRGTATTSTKARYAWNSGSLIVPDSVEVLTPILDTNQCPESLLKKLLNPRVTSRDKTSILAERPLMGL